MSKVKIALPNTKLPISNLLPQAVGVSDIDNLQFRNLLHFKHVVSKLKVANDSKHGIPYKVALDRLLKGTSGISEDYCEDIRTLVRSNLHKRGMITSEVYEEYKYTDSGTCVGIDVGKYAAGDPECIITPVRQYVDFFHELFINISYPYWVKDSLVQESTIKLLTAIRELERQHIFIKVTLILPIVNPSTNSNFFYSSIPLFSHREYKDFHTMASVVNASLLRKFYFAILEDFYGDCLHHNYGVVKKLPDTMNIGETFNEIAFFEKMQGKYSR